MMAAGTRAPIEMAAKAKPANHPGQAPLKQAWDDAVRPTGPGRLDAASDCEIAKQGDQPEQDGVDGNEGGVALDGLVARGAERAGHRVGVEEQEQPGSKWERAETP